MRYTYCFSLRPDESRRDFGKPLFDVFRLINARVEMEFYEDEFRAFRDRLLRDGFTLRAITRTQFNKPEVVL